MASEKVGWVLVYQADLGRGDLVASGQAGSQQSHQGEQSKQDRAGASNGAIRPLTLRYKAEVSTNLLEGDLDTPTENKPRKDLFGRTVQPSTQQGDRIKALFRIANEDPADRQWREAAVIPDGGGGGNLDSAGALPIPVRNAERLPTCVATGEDFFRVGKSSTFQTWT